MAELLYWAAVPGLVLLILGIIVANVATSPPAGYVGTIGAGIGVVLLASHALGGLLGG